MMKKKIEHYSERGIMAKLPKKPPYATKVHVMSSYKVGKNNYTWVKKKKKKP